MSQGRTAQLERPPAPAADPDVASAPTGGIPWAGALRRGLGLALILLVVLPVYRLVDSPVTGVAGNRTVIQSDATAAFLGLASLLVLIPAILLARFVSPGALERLVGRASDALLRPRPVVFAGVLALLITCLTWLFSVEVFGGRPVMIDAVTQLLHARVLAAGHWALSVEGLAPFRHVQNALETPWGWVSQYPPGFVALLALGMRLGATILVGPLLAGVTVFCTSLAAERLLPRDRATARLGACLLAVSPFVIGLAGAYMNHIAVAAASSVALYAALRAAQGSTGWAALSGAALGFAFTVRPLGALALGLPLTLGVWLGARSGFSGLARRTAVAAMAAAPFLAFLAVYNNIFFGSPLRFGYDAAWGARAGLGFHLDPWGNRYGPLEAIGFTSSDLVALSLNLLETPVPAVVVVGAYLLLARRLSGTERLLVAWALLPVVANLLYWHHGLFLGPRMLNEAAAGWILLCCTSAVGLARLAPASVRLGGARYSPRVALASIFAVSLLAGCVLAPQRLRGASQGYRSLLTVRAPRTPGPALVFVHDAWTARLAARLGGRGMSLDSVETALRQNDACDLQHFVDAYETPAALRSAPVPSVDFVARSTGLLPVVEITPGNAFRSAGLANVSADCRREILADRLGIVDITPFLWQTDLPGLPGRGALVVRDLGPEANAVLIRRFPRRTPFAYLRPAPDSAPVLAPYGEAMAVLWGQSARADSMGLTSSGGRPRP